MRLKITHVAFAMLLLVVFANGDLCPTHGANPVVVDGNLLTVHAEGMSLGELLMVVEDMTGVQFAFNELIATEKIFLDFKGVPLPEAIKKIVRPLSFAAIYDGTGKLRKVIILGRMNDSGMEEKGDSAEVLPRNLSEGITFTPEEGLDNAESSKGYLSEKGPVQSNGAHEKRRHPVDGPQESQNQEMEGPPPNKTYSVYRPPNTQNQIVEELPDAGSTDHPPPTDNRKPPMDGPPLDRPYLIDGPPD